MGIKTVLTIISVLVFISMMFTLVSLAQISYSLPNLTANPITTNTNTIDCDSKKGTADTQAGNFKYGSLKCECDNGGTLAAGGINSDSESIRLHDSKGPNDNSHIGGISRDSKFK